MNPLNVWDSTGWYAEVFPVTRPGGYKFCASYSKPDRFKELMHEADAPGDYDTREQAQEAIVKKMANDFGNQYGFSKQYQQEERDAIS